MLSFLCIQSGDHTSHWIFLSFILYTATSYSIFAWMQTNMKCALPTLGFICFFLTGCGKSEHQYQGYVEAQNVYLSSPSGGKLLFLKVKRGQFVEKGDPLYALDPDPELFSLDEQEALYKQSLSTLKDLQEPRRKQEIEAIEAQLKQAEAQLSLAEIRLRRNQILYDKKVLDKDSLDAAMERFHEMTALTEQMTANLELARLGSRRDRINAQQYATLSIKNRIESLRWQISQKQQVAPTAGIIFDTYYRPGEYVGSEHPVVSILAPEYTHIEFFVPLDELKNIHLGQQIDYTYENQHDRHRAQIVYIASDAEYMPPLVYSRNNSDKIVFRIKADILRRDRLFPGEPVVVYIGASHHE